MTLRIRMSDGAWLALPATFEVKSGETLGEMLAREGDREYVDPSSGQTYTLRALYAAAGASLRIKLRTTDDALLLLEGPTLDITPKRRRRRRP